MSRPTFIALLALTCLIGPLAHRPAHAQAPDIQIPDDNLRAGLLDSYRQSISEYLTHWAGQLRQAQDLEGVREARDKLTSAFNKYNGRPNADLYRRIYAETAAQVLPEQALRGARQLVQINAALALRAMEETTVTPGLDQLVVHPNVGVRYIGWAGYQGIQSELLAQGRQAIEAMLNVAGQRLPKETNGPLIGAIYDVLRLRRTTGAVLPGALANARKRAIQIILASWPQRVQQVRAGRIAMADAARLGVRALREDAPALGGGRSARGPMLQGLIDMLDASLSAFARLEDPEAPSALTLMALMADIEGALAETTDVSAQGVREAVGDSRASVKDRYDRARLALLDWVDRLQDYGVKQP
jgi:hypothetical protein